MIQWPWSDVISYVMRYARPTGADDTVLEVGCGTGANIPFFKKAGCRYFGIDGSVHVIDQVKLLHPDLADRLHCGVQKQWITGNGLQVGNGTIISNHQDELNHPFGVC